MEASDTNRQYTFWPVFAIKATGTISLVVAVFGLYQNASVLMFSKPIAAELAALSAQTQGFWVPLYIMIGVNVSCFLILGWCGLEQLQLRSVQLAVFVALFLFELLFALFVGRVLFHSANIGKTIALVAGITLPRLFLPWFILLPVWGPILLYWGKRRLWG